MSEIQNPLFLFSLKSSVRIVFQNSGFASHYGPIPVRGPDECLHFNSSAARRRTGAPRGENAHHLVNAYGKRCGVRETVWRSEPAWRFRWFLRANTLLPNGKRLARVPNGSRERAGRAHPAAHRGIEMEFGIGSRGKFKMICSVD